jgi:superfamily II DNA or RNA helicase
VSATYAEFLDRKLHTGADHGFEPVFMPPQLFDFQQALVEWAVRKGRAAIFADCGLGKTAMQLTWAENVARHTGRPVLILTPLAVAAQTIREGEKFGIEAHRSGDGAVRNLGLTAELDQPGDQSSLFDLEAA